jgi:superfamily II DNA or RNA helicase
MQLMGGASEKELNYAKSHANIILTTYQYMGTGCSIPRMDAIILATPRKRKSKQYIGRIFRLGSNYDSIREVIDLVDMSNYMKNQYYMRKKYYDNKKFPIKTRRVSWNILREEMIKLNIISDEPNEPDKLTTIMEEFKTLLKY